MTFFTQPSREAAQGTSTERAASGPRLGFLESFEASYDAQVRASSQFGIEYAMHELDWQQTQALIAAGVENPPQLMLSLEGRDPQERDDGLGGTIFDDGSRGYYREFSPGSSGAYLDVARHYGDEGSSEEFVRRLQEYDDAIRKLSEDRPELQLRTSDQMFEAVRERAKGAEALDGSDKTLGGEVGSFIGGTLASVDPDTDPLNFGTLAVGGGGRTVLQRIGVQAGAQGAIEGANQALGVQEERRLLGLSSGFQDALTRVGATALGGAAIQGVGEVVAAGAKRFFRSTPKDPAPEPEAFVPPVETEAPARRGELPPESVGLAPRSVLDELADAAPLSGLPVSRQRVLQDMRTAEMRLQDWEGEPPAFLPVRTESASYAPEPQVRFDGDIPGLMREATIETRAREFDVPAFRKYDAVREEYTQAVDDLKALELVDEVAVLQELDAASKEVDRLVKLRASTRGKSKVKSLERKIEKARQKGRELIENAEAGNPEVLAAKQRVQDVYAEVQDLAPTVARAYAKAKNEWEVTERGIQEAVDAVKGNRELQDVPTLKSYDEFSGRQTLADRAPILKRADKEAFTPADTAASVLTKDATELAKSLDRFNDMAKKAIDAIGEEDGGFIYIAGSDHKFDIEKDTMFVPNEDGTGGREVSVRELLDDSRKSQEELEAVTTCSV